MLKVALAFPAFRQENTIRVVYDPIYGTRKAIQIRNVYTVYTIIYIYIYIYIIPWNGTQRTTVNVNIPNSCPGRGQKCSQLRDLGVGQTWDTT